MRDSDVRLLIGQTLGRMAYTGVAPGIYPFKATGRETRSVEMNLKAWAALALEQELEMRIL